MSQSAVGDRAGYPASTPVKARANGVLQLGRFLTNPLTYLDRLRGDPRDVVPFTLGNLPAHLVTKPELLHEAMFNEDWPPLSRGRLMGLAKWYGEGLFLPSGPEPHRQRDDLWKPLFRQPRATRIALERTQRLVDSWVEGEPLEMYRTLRTHCWAIDWEAMTGTDLGQRPDLL